jgi:hypothetical protein
MLAVGAILAFAVHVDTNGFDINTIGVILMVVGILGVLVSMFFWSSWGGFGNRRETVMVDRDPSTRRVVEDVPTTTTTTRRRVIEEV